MRYLALLLLLITSSSWASEGRIYAQRVSASGVAVGDPIEINSGTTGHTQSQPRVSFFDDRFLVVWQEWDTVSNSLDVKGARIGMDGTVLDSTPIDIASTTRTDAVPDVAADTTGWMAVWHSFDGESAVWSEVYARRVNYDGSLDADENTLKFGDAAYDNGSLPRISWSPDEGKFCVVYGKFKNAYAAYAQFGATLLSTTPTVDTPQSTNSDIGKDSYGIQYYTIAAMPGGGWSYALSGVTGIYNSYGGQAVVHIDSNNTTPVGSYMDGKKISNATTSNFLDNNKSDSGYAYGTQALAPDTNSGYIIAVWSRYHQGNTNCVGANPWTLCDSDLYAGRIGGTYGDDLIESIGGTAISTTSAHETDPGLAGDNNGNLLLSYTKETDGSSEIIGKILAESNGITVTGGEITIRSDAVDGSRRGQSAVAYGDDGDGANPLFLVVWTEGFWGTL